MFELFELFKLFELNLNDFKLFWLIRLERKGFAPQCFQKFECSQVLHLVDRHSVKQFESDFIQSSDFSRFDADWVNWIKWKLNFSFTES